MTLQQFLAMRELPRAIVIPERESAMPGYIAAPDRTDRLPPFGALHADRAGKKN